MTAPTNEEVRQQLDKFVTERTEAKVDPVAGAFFIGYVDVIAGYQAWVRKGSRDAPPTGGFRIPHHLLLVAGDEVWCYELGSERRIIHATNRNAVIGSASPEGGPYQPFNVNLSELGDLTPLNDDIPQRKAGAWTNRTMAELAADLPATAGDAVALAAHAVDTTVIHGIADTAALVLTGDARLTDARTPTAHVLADGAGLGAQHTTSGLTAGWVLRATAAAAAKFMQLVHGDLGSVGADDHHNKSHGHTGADGSGTVAHSATSGQTTDDHHAKSHAHNGSDGSGSVAHSSTTGQTANDHHNQSHTNADHSAAGTPSTQAFGDTAATGSSTADAKSDHKHAMPALGTGSTNAAAGNDARFPTSGEKTWLTNGLAGNVAFPATQNASADANTLDDYEEGSMTPVLLFGGASTGITYTTQTGKYIVIGGLVFVVFRITLSNKGSAIGAATISGLPFAAASVIGGLWFDFFQAMAGLTTPSARISTGTTAMTLQQVGAVAMAGLTDANFGNSSDFIITGTYTRV